MLALAVTLLLATTLGGGEGPHPLWWVLVAGVIAFATRAVDLASLWAKARGNAVEDVIRRCNNLEAEVSLLKAKDQEQQRLIDKLESQRDDLIKSLAGALEKITSLAEQVAAEQDLKHACRRQIQAAVTVIDLYRAEYQQHHLDHFNCDAWREKSSSITPLASPVLLPGLGSESKDTSQIDPGLTST